MKPHFQNGFTLMEVLLGMSLLSVMMVMLFGSLRVCVQNWDAGEAKFDKVSRAAIIRNFFTSHLQNVLPLTDLSSPQIPFSFQGEANSLQFVSSMPASAGRLGVQLFSVTMAGKQDGEVKVSMRPFFGSAEGSEWKLEEVVILKHVKKLSFGYFGGDPNNPTEAPTWSDTWLEQQQTPILVKVAIEMNDGEIWPEQIVALKVDNAARGPNANPFGIVNGRFTN